jgi:hypothetical protein
MGGRTTYRTLSSKRAPFQIWVDWWSHLRKVPRRRRISHTHPVWLWGCSSCKISSPGPVLHGTKWLLWRPHIQSPTLHSRCVINKGLIKRGSTVDHWRWRWKGWILRSTPYTYIHSFIHLFIPPFQLRKYSKNRHTNKTFLTINGVTKQLLNRYKNLKQIYFCFFYLTLQVAR